MSRHGLPTPPAGLPGTGAETAELTRRVAALDRGLETGGDRLDPAVAVRVADALSGVRERLALGVEHTLVAFVGGTGSGKSSLFNAVSGLEFADVGVRRPTTSRVSACVWGVPAEPLLDWLEVAADRRIARESELDGESQAALRGLVLLDLPDHDSVESSHRVVVDRLVPMVDLLVWVVDPQKYADDALHSGYLRQLVGHEAAMVVVLNQVDTVPADMRHDLTEDVGRLLVEDGLTGVPVLEASARTGEGVTALRELLADVVTRRSVAAARASAEVNDAATLLAGQVAATEPAVGPSRVEEVVRTLGTAAGLPAIADAVEAVVRGGASGVPAFGTIQSDTVEMARASWLAAVAPALPGGWQQSLADRVATVDALRDAVNERLATVTVRATPSRSALALVVLAAVAGLGALVVAAVAVGALLDGGSAADAGLGWAWPVAVGLLLLAVLLIPAAALARGRAGRHRAGRVLADGRAALADVVRGSLGDPTSAVLAEHREVRELAAAARSVAEPPALEPVHPAPPRHAEPAAVRPGDPADLSPAS